MSGKVKSSNKFVGLKQSKRAIELGIADKAFIALDSADHIRQSLEELCRKHSVPFEHTPSMKELGERFGIDVGSAIAVITKQQ